jgi:hypothetical protein
MTHAAIRTNTSTGPSDELCADRNVSDLFLPGVDIAPPDRHDSGDRRGFRRLNGWPRRYRPWGARHKHGRGLPWSPGQENLDSRNMAKLWLCRLPLEKVGPLSPHLMTAGSTESFAVFQRQKTDREPELLLPHTRAQFLELTLS